MNKREFDEALSEYDEAIRLDPMNGMAHWGRGAASTEKGEFGQAIASLDAAIRLVPKIGGMPFSKRYRTAAETSRSLGHVVVLMFAVGLCLLFAFAARSSLRHRKPKPDTDL